MCFILVNNIVKVIFYFKNLFIRDGLSSLRQIIKSLYNINNECNDLFDNNKLLFTGVKIIYRFFIDKRLDFLIHNKYLIFILLILIFKKINFYNRFADIYKFI